MSTSLKPKADAAPASCPYCGNNPVSHAITKLSDYFTHLTKSLDSIAASSLGTHISNGLSLLAVPCIRLANRIGLIRFNSNAHDAACSRSKVIWEEALRRGIPMRQLVVLGHKTDLYETRINNRTIVFESLPIPSWRKTTSLNWLDDKLELKRTLHAANIPVAQGAAFTRFKPMADFFQTLTKPVIVKPSLGSRGRHTTTFIHTLNQLEHAFKVGKQISRSLVIEEHLIGSVYRGTIVDGVLVGVLRGDPPRVTGDGTHTIRELIDIKNTARHPRVKEFQITSLTEQFLSRSGYTLDSVLPKHKVIDLTEKIGVSYGGYSAEEFDICHPKIKQTLEAAGRAVNFPVIGFDFIIEDITKDPDTQKWGIIEANSLPFIDLHHHPVEGPSINAAKYVWDLWN